MRWIARNKVKLIFAVCGIALIFLYSLFNFTAILPGASTYAGQVIFSWPDAMANNFFINNFIHNSSFALDEPLNVILNNIIHPRSTNIVGESIVPTGFPGMLIVFGLIGKIIPFATLFITPFLAVLTILLFYKIISKVFNEPIAKYSAILLALLGPFIYYANQVMLSTICFIFFFLLAIYLGMVATNSIRRRSKAILFFISGLAFAISVMTRPIEIIWMILLLLIPIIIYRGRFRLKDLILFLSANIVALIGWAYYNFQTYGEYFTLGYLRMEDQSADIVARLPGEISVGSHSQIVSILKLIFIPFGFHPRVILHNFNNYFLAIVWPLAILFVVGIVLLIIRLRQKQNKAITVYLISAMLAGAWLVFYYGNWLFIDQLVLDNNTIGNSYVRYWVPLYILLIPVAGFLFYYIQQKIKNKSVGYPIIVLLILCFAYFNINQAFFSKADGLIDQKAVTETYYNQARLVSEYIGPNAILITDRADKLFFPKYQVIVFNGGDNIFNELGKILDNTPIYYFTMMSNQEIELLNTTELSSKKLEMTTPRQIDNQFRIFRLIPIINP